MNTEWNTADQLAAAYMIAGITGHKQGTYVLSEAIAELEKVDPNIFRTALLCYTIHFGEVAYGSLDKLVEKLTEFQAAALDRTARDGTEDG